MMKKEIGPSNLVLKDYFNFDVRIILDELE
jgi:hypothetical protein